MHWKMRKEFIIAFEKAKEILSKIKYYPEQEEMMRTADIIEAVEKQLGIDVKFTTYDFKDLFNSERETSNMVDTFGAAMCYNKKEKSAVILLNEKETPAMRRFSLVHELGHLMISNLDVVEGCKVSTHIDMDITSIPDEVLDRKEYDFLIEEQQANIFALLVLIPSNMFARVIDTTTSMEEAADFFGVSKKAIRSRLELEFKRNEFENETK